jgi:hypothetical protein
MLAGWQGMNKLTIISIVVQGSTPGRREVRRAESDQAWTPGRRVRDGRLDLEITIGKTAQSDQVLWSNLPEKRGCIF